MGQDGLPNEEEFLKSLLSGIMNEPDEDDLGALMRQRREELGLSERQAARAFSMTQGAYRLLESGDTKAINPKNLRKLQYFLKMDVEQVLRLTSARMTPNDGAEMDTMREIVFIAENFDVRGLKKIGFIDSVADSSAIRKRLESFFGLKSIFDYKNVIAPALFSATRRRSSDKMREFWVRSAFMQFERFSNPYEFDRTALLDLVPQVHQYTRFERNGLLTVARALFQIGVTVIAQDHLPGTQVRGATFIVNGKPCIVLTQLGSGYATVWFALMHELAHVIYHWEQLTRVRYHMSGEEDLLLTEDEADYFARELLFSEEKLNYIESFIGSPHVVQRYAKQHNVHPSIIYGFYAFRKYREEGDNSAYILYKQHMGSPESAIKAIRCYPWDKESIETDIQKTFRQLDAK